MVTQAIELCGPKLKGVFGGAGGRYMLLEYPRGVAGQMPGCHVTDVMVRFWDALDGGDLAEAKRIYGLLAPLYAHGDGQGGQLSRGPAPPRRDRCASTAARRPPWAWTTTTASPWTTSCATWSR